MLVDNAESYNIFKPIWIDLIGYAYRDKPTELAPMPGVWDFSISNSINKTLNKFESNKLIRISVRKYQDRN